MKTCVKIKNNFVSATGINLDCYMRLFNYLTAGNDLGILSSMKFTSVCQRESTQILRKLNLVQNPKISAKEQLFVYLSWLKNTFTFLFQNPKLLGQISYIFLLARYLFGIHMSKSQKYVKNIPRYSMHIRLYRTSMSTTVLPFYSKLVKVTLQCHI